MPDKRNVSKQRRQSRNRATREALAARSENAQAAPAATSSTSRASDARGSSGRGSRATGDTVRRGGGRPRPVMVAYEPPPPGLKGLLTSTRIGDKAVLTAFLLAVMAAAVGLFSSSVGVDDRGEPLPNRFAGLSLAAREAVTGQPVPDTTVSVLDAYGAVALMLVGTPVLICAFALWANRRPDRARVLTFSLMAMVAATILFVATPLMFAPLIALGVAVFRVRKSDLVVPDGAAATGGQARGASAEGAGSSGRPPSFLERLLGGGAAGAGGSRTADDEAVDDEDVDVTDDADPLAELEAELAAEDDAGDADDAADDTADDASSGSAHNKG